jgi:hypothetical protein
MTVPSRQIKSNQLRCSCFSILRWSYRSNESFSFWARLTLPRVEGTNQQIKGSAYLSSSALSLCRPITNPARSCPQAPERSPGHQPPRF